GENEELSLELTTTRRAERLEAPIDVAELTERVCQRAWAEADYPGIRPAPTRPEEDARWCFNGYAGALIHNGFLQVCAGLLTGGTLTAAYLACSPAPQTAENLTFHQSWHATGGAVGTKPDDPCSRRASPF